MVEVKNCYFGLGPRSGSGVGLLVSLCALILVLLGTRTAEAGKRFPTCPLAGDAMGEAIAYGGDFNGDGVMDVAIASACAWMGSTVNAGKVEVFSGTDGTKLLTKKGSQARQYLGVGLAFIGDLDGDGKDEIAVGSPGYDATPGDFCATIDKLRNSGKLEIFNAAGDALFQACGGESSGAVKLGMYGKSVAGLSDGNDDGIADFAVGSPGARRGKDNKRTGRVYLYSGKTKKQLSLHSGPKRGARFGKRLVAAGDVDGDGIDDLILASEETGMNGARKSGLVRILSGRNIDSIILQKSGAKKDAMGASVAAAGDVDGDGRADFVVGSATADDRGIRNAGGVTLFSANGDRLLDIVDPKPRTGQRFGSSIAVLGEVNGDGSADFAIGSSHRKVARRGTATGRILAMSGNTRIWIKKGPRAGSKYGYVVTAGPASDSGAAVGDTLACPEAHSPCLWASAPGDAPLWRRGAGSVRLISGKTGKTLAAFAGRRGLETRLYTLGFDGSGDPRIATFGPRGLKKTSEVRASVSDFTSPGNFSIGILYGNPRNPDPFGGGPKLVVGMGANSNSSKVGIFRARDPEVEIARFEAFPGVSSGAVVAAGNIDDDSAEEIIAVQASSGDGNVRVGIFERVGAEHAWVPGEQFFAFRGADIVSEFYGIQAGGGTVAVADVTGDKQDEIIIGTFSGVPMVRIFSGAGKKITEFLAYEPTIDGVFEKLGVSVAAVQVNGGGPHEIVTVPLSGRPVIRVFTGEGKRFRKNAQSAVVEIDVLDKVAVCPAAAGLGPCLKSDYLEGGYVTGADVDFDGKQEIIFVRGGGGGHERDVEVVAFELDGSQVGHMAKSPLMPFVGGSRSDAVAIIGTDYYQGK